MPQDFGDLRKRCPSSNHLSGQAMAEKVSGATAGAMDPRSRDSAPNDMANGGWSGEAVKRRIHPLECAAGITDTTILAKILSQRRADIRQQW